MKIDGKKIAEVIIEKLRSRGFDKLTTKNLGARFFGAVLVGEDPASISFLKQKEKVAKELGIDFRLYKFAENISQDELRKEVGKIVTGKTCGGMIVQLPLPEHINKHYVLNAIPREKDVDVLGERALGAFYTGRNLVNPPAVGVVEEIFKQQNIDLQDKIVAVVGVGFLVGKPISMWLQGKVQEIYLLDQGSNLVILKQADLVISGVGQTGIIKAEVLKNGAGVIDFGISNKDGNLSGDLDDPNLEKLAFYTPTPGGTGPILVAKLFENFFMLNQPIN